MKENAGAPKPSFTRRARTVLIGAARNPFERSIFHKLSLVAFFAWVGLGADGLSSSCYGPAEAYLALGRHVYLGIFVGLATAFTVIVISASYAQIIELFPSGGGGYLVASKLLSPTLGMVAGSALIIDYVLTIAVSVASGADAIFSFLPPSWLPYKLALAVAGVSILTLLNLRGVRESVLPLVPIFLVFLLTHAAAIVYALVTRAHDLPQLVDATRADFSAARGELGLFGVLVLMLHSYSMGAGTYTGIEAVSNATGILREPRVRTAKRTMFYMASSLATVALGLMIAYVLFGAAIEPGKTLNADLFDRLTYAWGGLGVAFVLAALVSEAAILFVAAQTGFLGGPRVVAAMAIDRWVPGRFALLSDRLVTHNGIVFMGAAALAVILATRGRVGLLVILYSINVFITFVLSQGGMVRHWWSVRKRGASPGAGGGNMAASSDGGGGETGADREAVPPPEAMVEGFREAALEGAASHGGIGGRAPAWRRKIVINSLGLATSGFILVMVTAVKFNEGGWVTLVITGSVIALAVSIKRRYARDARTLSRLDELVNGAEALMQVKKYPDKKEPAPTFDPHAKTAVILVNGFNGMGLHAFLEIRRLFGQTFRNFAFVMVGAIDAGNFKGIEEMDNLRKHLDSELARYVEFAHFNGYFARPYGVVGVDVVHEIVGLAPEIVAEYPDAVFFGGQLVFPTDSAWDRWLHNYVVFGVQRGLYREGIPFVLLPVRV